MMEIDNYEQIKDEVFNYCNEKKKKGEPFSLYDVHIMRGKGVIEADWNTSAILYGMWFRSTSNLEVESFTDKEW